MHDISTQRFLRTSCDCTCFYSLNHTKKIKIQIIMSDCNRKTRMAGEATTSSKNPHLPKWNIKKIENKTTGNRPSFVAFILKDIGEALYLLEKSWTLILKYSAQGCWHRTIHSSALSWAQNQGCRKLKIRAGALP